MMPLGLPRPRTLLLLSALYAAVAFLAYGNSLSNDFVTWDDIGLITENPDITRINTTTVKNVFSRYDPELYVPLTFVSYQIDHAIGGLNPAIYHTTNLVLHVLNALLVAVLLYALSGAGWISIGLGLIFLLHPLNTEVVAWASARKDVLSTFFFLGSLLTYLMSRSGSSRTIVLTVSVTLFALGLLSKVMVVMLPALLFLLDWLEGRRLSKESVLEKIPYFLFAIFFGVVALFGKATILASSTLLEKFLMACKSTVFYLWKFVFPTGLTFAYSYNGVIRLTSPDFFLPVIVVFSLGCIAWFLHKKHRPLTFALAFFFLTLLPTFTNFFRGGDAYFASDRYAYIPMIGLLLFLAYVSEAWIQGTTVLRRQKTRIRTVATAFTLVACVFVFLAAKQASTWKESSTLYAHALQLYPQTRAAHHNLGMEYLAAGDAASALDEFNKAFAIKEDVRTRTNRGAALVMLGRLQDARVEYEIVMKTYPDDPDAYYGIGNIEYKLQNFDAAIRMYRRALEIKPDYINALNNLGGLYVQMKRWDDAIDTLQQSLKLHPEFAASHYNLAGAYQAKGMNTEAQVEYEKTIELSPFDADALAQLAVLLYDKHEIDPAATMLRRSLQSDPSNPTAHTLLQRMKNDGVAE